jgi:membrane protease YdiL (CAAX protease family)
MKKISAWAKRHVVPARIIIIISFLLLTGIGVITGLLLAGLDIELTGTFLAAAIVIYLAAVFAYPSRSLKSKGMRASVFYTRQKVCDILLAAATFCMIVFFANQPGQLFRYASPVQGSSFGMHFFPKDSTLVKHKTLSEFAASLKNENGQSLKWKEKKKLLKEQVRAIKQSDMSNGAKTGLIILCVFAALGLLALVGALACDLSCNGSEAAAVLVLIGGAALIIFLLVIAIKAIKRKNKKQKDNRVGPDTGS